MVLLLGDITSRRFWRTAYSLDRAPGIAYTPPAGAECAHRARDILAALPEWIPSSEVVHACVFSRRQWRITNTTKTHILGMRVPPNSFYAFDENTYVTSPSFEFLRMAKKVDIRQLIAFGDELCGYYSFDPQSDRGFRERSVPLTSKKKISQYLAGAQGYEGHELATRALRYMVDGSASPMETVAELLNCLPFKLGGYCLPTPVMNYDVKLSASASRIAEQQHCYADICYPSIGLDIEYLGKYDHSKCDSFDSDRARVNALIGEGYEVIELTFDQLKDLSRYEEIVKHIAKRAGKRLRPVNLGPTPERRDARRLLFEWNRLYGEPGM